MRYSYFYDYILNHNYRKIKSFLKKVGEMVVCDICLQAVCPPRCPNAPEPVAVFICSGCGNYIYEGEDYWDLMGEQWCEDCVKDARRIAEYDPY